MISLAEIFSNKNTKRPMIVAFLNSSGVMWTTGPKLPRLIMKSIRQAAFFNDSKEKKIGGDPTQRRNVPKIKNVNKINI